MSVIFKINGLQYEVTGEYGPDVSLNEFIRNVADLRGTKAMCHEGGCGACIVAVKAALPPTNELRIFAVNSCLVSVLSCHGWEVITVEGIGNRTISYHEIQSRLANFNGTQCGFCTPGWVMNMYSLYESKDKTLTMEEIENSFAGNICRCTGYRPIADAFKSFAKDADQKILDKLVDLEDLAVLKPCGVKCSNICKHKNKECKQDDNETQWCVLNKDVDDKTIVIDCGSHKWYKVFKLEEAFNALKNGDYKLISGNTGQGVYHVNDYPKNVIDIFSVKELKDYFVDVNLVLGAGMTLTAMMDLFSKLSSQNEDFFYLQQFYDHMDLVAHLPVRNIGTIGGNLYLKHLNKEFPSDLFLLFETVGASITIAHSYGNETVLTMPEFLDSDMRGKIIINIRLPPLSRSCKVKTFKIMPRSQNSHAIVNAGFFFHIEANKVKRARIVYGNIAKSFMHAVKTEALLVGKDLYSDEVLQEALKSIYEEVIPEDMAPEPAAKFRRMLAVTLYYKAILYLCPTNKKNPKYISGGETMKRVVSKGTQVFDTDKNFWPVNQPIPKIEALVQCSGEATFANDLPKQNNEVFGAFVRADVPPGSIIEGFDISNAMKLPGVIKLYTAQDIPGKNCFTPTIHITLTDDEEILCVNTVKYYGQPAAIIVADREKTAVKAAKLVKIKYKSKGNSKPLITIQDVLDSTESATRIQKDIVVEPHDKGENVEEVIVGEFSVGSQYHYQMETQTCVAIPTEDGMDVYAATQWLDLTNAAIAQCLNVPMNRVNVIVRRLGGGYGSKVTRATHIACAAALICHLQGKTCRFILPLQTNMKVVGKRAPATCKYEVGVNKVGEIQYLKNTVYSDSGISFNENMTYLISKFFKNSYDSDRWYIEGYSVKTDNPSSTFCRAPSSTEAVAMIENIMERIAFKINKDPLDVRLQNMDKQNNMIPDMIKQLKEHSSYDERMEEVKAFNNQNRWRKRGLKMVPLTYVLDYFGSFSSTVSVYHVDGTVSITHSGIEMGQGINTKAAQVCAYVLGLPLDKISVKPSSSIISPNAMVTGGSVGSDCVALATIKACEILLEALAPIKKEMKDASWEELVEKAHQSGVNLQTSYCFTKSGEMKGYDVYAVCALEVEVDILTGNHDVRRVDLLEDVGRSLSPEIDVGQIEGALVMGLGYWTSEKLVYENSTGELLTDRTWTYKPPGIKDIPADMRIYFQRNSESKLGPLQSKATGEPAICLATVIIHAIREAVRSARLDAGYKDEWFDIENPCTVENIFQAVGHKFEHFKLS